MSFERFDVAIDLVKAGARLDEADQSGFTPFTYGAWFIPKNHKARNSFFRFLAQKGILDDLSGSCIGHPELVALKWTRWQDLELFDIIDAMDVGFSDVLWKDIRWISASASTILALIERRAFADLTYPCSNSVLITPGDILGFALRYFDASRRAILNGASVLDKHLQDDWSPTAWRSLCQLAFRCVSTVDLSTAPTGSFQTPLVKVVVANWNSQLLPKQWRQTTHKILRSWLQDLQMAGIHLQTYGNNEQSMLQPRTELPWETTWAPCRPLSTPKLARIVSGPEPKDWVLDWDYFEPRYSRDFWELVEWELPPLPGSWVDT